jgi:hypothetical protein
MINNLKRMTASLVRTAQNLISAYKATCIEASMNRDFAKLTKRGY